MKLRRIICIILLSVFIYTSINCLCYDFSHHIIIDANNVASITFGGDNIEEYICSKEKEITTAIKEIKKINFFPSRRTAFEQSPISFISIKHKDGTETNISFTLIDALIYTIPHSPDKSNFYITFPGVVDRIVKKLVTRGCW